MTGPWQFWDQDPAPESRAHITNYRKSPSDTIFFQDSPGVVAGALFADALNVHEATGLTSSQLQSRVAELEAALQQALRFIREAPVSSGICCCGDSIDGHASAWNCGHTPVDMWDDASSSLLKELSPIAGVVYP